MAEEIGENCPGSRRAHHRRQFTSGTPAILRLRFQKDEMERVGGGEIKLLILRVKGRP
jgi:hypothetical protein